MVIIRAIRDGLYQYRRERLMRNTRIYSQSGCILIKSHLQVIKVAKIIIRFIRVTRLLELLCCVARIVRANAKGNNCYKSAWAISVTRLIRY